MNNIVGKDERINKMALLVNGGSIISILLISLVILTKPPVIEDVRFFGVPGGRTLLLSLGMVFVLFHYVWLGLLVIKYKYFKKIEWKKVGKILLMYALFIFIGYGAVASILSSGQITGYVYFKQDAWDTYINCFSPIHLFERPLYYLPFLFAILMLGYLVQKKSNTLIRYSTKLMPLFIAVQIGFILYFSNCNRKDLEFVNGAQDIPAYLKKYMPNEDSVRIQWLLQH
jgi:hypothetical protein